MLIIRPISMADYSALYHCARESGHGFTSLPENEESLKYKIKHSMESFRKSDVTAPGDEGYLMVGVDSESGKVVGTTGIEAAVGWDLPFYSYHIDTIVHSSRRLGVNKIVKLLSFGNNYTGCSELCSLFLLPQYREGGNGKLMSKSRFLMMAEHPERFSSTIIAEMRGVSDEQGNSPFWQWLQEHFFGIDFTLADYLAGSGHKGFIADLMPKLPIYVNLLSKDAQAVTGKVHEKTKPALKILEGEGFTCRDYVDIFDAGPTIECHRQHIRSVRNSFSAVVRVQKKVQGFSAFVSNTSIADFRAALINLRIDENREYASVTSEAAKNLLVRDGDRIRVLLNP